MNFYTHSKIKEILDNKEEKIKFEIYEVKEKRWPIRDYGHPDIFDKIKNIKSYTKPKKL